MFVMTLLWLAGRSKHKKLHLLPIAPSKLKWCCFFSICFQRLELLNVIHVRGCIHAVGLWLKDNFEATLGIVCSMLLPQVGGESGQHHLAFYLHSGGGKQFGFRYFSPLPLHLKSVSWV